MDLATALGNTHWLSVIVAAIASFFVGGIWYGPLWGRVWMKEFGISEEDLKKRNIPLTFGLSLVLALIAATVLDLFLGPTADLYMGAGAGFLAGAGWVATFLGILYLFEMQSLTAYLINASYCILSLTIMGTILGAW